MGSEHNQSFTEMELPTIHAIRLCKETWFALRGYITIPYSHTIIWGYMEITLTSSVELLDMR